MEKSRIPNAGLGAFLTYMGARKINKDSETFKICEELLSDCYFYEETTMSHLVAVMPDGLTKGVALTGENLHGNFNCVYWPKYLSDPIKAQVPSTNPCTETVWKSVNVRIVGECVEAFQELRNRPENGIGHLGMYKPENYEHVSGIPYSQNFCFELDAPYAPLGPRGKYEKLGKLIRVVV